ncbi:MAG: hypothetical protein ACXABY_11490 [Candidatus Thorarchaeota archaeon]
MTTGNYPQWDTSITIDSATATTASNAFAFTYNTSGTTITLDANTLISGVPGTQILFGEDGWRYTIEKEDLPLKQGWLFNEEALPPCYSWGRDKYAKWRE